MGGSLKRSIDLWIHLDSEVVILQNPLVTAVDFTVDPLLKCFTNESVDDVSDAIETKVTEA